MLTIVFVLWKQISCFYMLSIFLPVESFYSIRSSCVCIGDWDVREKRKKISQTSELLWLIMKWIYSIANLKVSLNSNNIIQNLTSFLLCHYSTEVLKKKKNRPSSSVLGGKGGGLGNYPTLQLYASVAKSSHDSEPYSSSVKWKCL